MFEKYSVKKVIEESKKNKKWDESVIKEKYIASFGIEKWQEEEMLERIIPLLIEVSNYLGIDPVPIVFDDIVIEDSRIYLKEEYIVITERFKNNYIECAKCVCHELRHLFQLYFVKISKDKNALRMKEELTSSFALNTNSQESISKYMMQEIEIDAYAFTKWYLKKYHNIDVMHPSNIYEQIIESYIIKNFK